ncbi:helix-turn-helix domain-containing protein [Streptomyces sp. NPDC059766]|uniref:helix-turn-helix domain-containing protein n=1 Tax=Streptomyces sp. NPDC059766 TaxID=3346940 RepID=UPI003663360E
MHTSQCDPRHTYPEAAAILRVDESWLRRHIKSLPHSKKGRVVTFTDDDLYRFAAQFHHEPPPVRAPAPPTSSRHPLAHLVPLPRRAPGATG